MEENTTNNTNKKKIIIVVIIFAILIIILGMYLSFNNNSSKQNNNTNSSKATETKKDTKKESKDTNDNTNQNNNESEYVDESYVCPEGLELLVDFIGYRGVFGPNNMLDSKDIRIQYIQFLLMEENKVTWTKGEYQSYPYIKEEEFKNKYNETLDTTIYNYDNDKDSTIFTDCNSHDETKNQNYKCWNGTWGVYGNKIYLYVKNNDDTVISGEYKRSSNETGKFEIKYTINNNKKYLKSVIMNSN